MADMQGRFSREDGMAEADGAGDSRSALLEAALHCFAQRGFDGTSIRDIAAEAGRNSALISHHFGSKEGLYEDVFRRVLATRKSALDHVLEASEPPRGRAEAAIRLRCLITALCTEFIVPHQAQGPDRVLGRKLLLHELRDPRPGVAALLEGLVAPWITALTECLAVLRPEGSEGARRFLATSVMGQMMIHLMMQGLHPCGSLLPLPEASEAADLLVGYNLRALGVEVP